MDSDDRVAEIEEWVRQRERSIRRRHRLDRIWRRTGPALRVVVAVLLAGAGILVVRHLTSDGEQSAANAAAPTPSASTAAPAGPFAGTPAAGYPKGAAGITLPPAKAVQGFSAKQVTADLAKVRTALIASRLDPRMTDRHDTSGFVKLLAPASQTFAKTHFGTETGLSLATWIDPLAPLDPAEQPRVSGRVSYVSKVQQGIPMLTVTTNFIWVYAFRRADHPVAAEHAEIIWTFSESPHLQPQDRGMFISSVNGYSALVDCAATTRGMLAPTPLNGGAVPDPSDTEDPNQLLNADHGLEIHDDC
ncbi:hypothetical protein [Actinoplanes sp. NPDC026619]|uniref:hypothetical protein n=1 Tax=Actinoplanes sp. NPDC026619 TaxID=3155798 RepID=UPI0033E1B0DD